MWLKYTDLVILFEQINFHTKLSKIKKLYYSLTKLLLFLIPYDLIL